MDNNNKRNPTVVIIGAGMTGILMAIKLREAGVTDITILEKNSNIGGTWLENTYPGVACDIPAHLYTYSFEPNPQWSKRFADGQEIQQYFEGVCRKYDVTRLIKFNEAAAEVSYDQGKWTVETSSNNTLIADFLISATGILHQPNTPKFPGIESFEGAMFHTARWDHSVDLSNKRVGIIGTGSTASQIIATIPPQVEKLSVFQRTAQWVIPIPNRDYSEKLKQKCRDSRLRMEFTKSVYHFIFEQIFSKALVGNKISHAILNLAARLNLRLSVKDKILRDKLTPNYTVGCKRLVMSNKFYSGVQHPNVDLVTDKIDCITPEGVKTTDGRIHQLDVLVLSTGFDPVAFMRPLKMTGINGAMIQDTWQNKVRAYRSLMLPDYPNYFLMLGPNTPIGNFSVIAMSEVQTAYVVKLIGQWQDNKFDEVTCTAHALDKFNAYLKAGMGNTVWTSGCQSWYLDSDGDPLSWPYSWQQWTKEMDTPDMRDFATASFSSRQKTTIKPSSVET